MPFEKELIWKREDIDGNIKDFRQEIAIYYYPPTDKKSDKIAIYFRWFDRENGEPRGKKSIFFASFEQLKAFLKGIAMTIGLFGRKRNKFTEMGWKMQTGNIANEVLDKIRGELKR